MKRKLDKPEPIAYTDDEALAFMLDTRMTVPQYQQTRNGARTRNADIYPPYRSVLEAKLRCYPKNIKVDDFSAEVPLQDLLNHTAERILEVQQDVLSLDPAGPHELVLLSKWGFDSSTGQRIHHQVTTQSSEGVCENSLFVVSVVPLKIHMKGHSDMIVWKNPTPSSTRYCRQLSFAYKKETPELSREVMSKIQGDIDNLEPTQCSCKFGRVEISHRLVFTMVDGKVVSAVTNTASASTCPTCKATPKQMNDLNLVVNPQSENESLMFGISPMHLYIRSFEMFIHISIRLDLPNPTWQIRGEVNKTLAKQKKYKLQRDFKKEWGMTIETPSDGGQGNSNSGNTGRRFFSDPQKAAILTGVSQELIERFGILLSVVNSTYEIDAEKFESFCHETASMYVKLYSWFYMPQSVHRLLVHGGSVLKQLSSIGFTLGETSEEAQETRNKDHKYAREHHTRKVSRTKTNEDQMHYMMVTSDPLITSLRKPQTTRKDSFPTGALDLLKVSNPASISSLFTDESEDNDILLCDENENLVFQDEPVLEVDSNTIADNIDLPDYYFAE